MTESQGRRKACQRCITGKRRCDLRRPSCGRCSKHSWLCNYIPQGNQASGTSSQEQTRSISSDELARGIPGDRATGEQDNNFVPLAYPPSDFAAEVSLPPARLRYCAQELASWIQDMVKKVQTPFMKAIVPHDHLPDPLREAFNACAAYTCKTEANGPLVRTMVSQCYIRLLSRAAHADLEIELATVQAVLMLHILSLFESDVQYHRLAEAQMGALRSKVLHLQRRSLQELPDQSTAAGYSEWLLMENVRRTVLASTLAESIYIILKDGVCKTVPFLSMQPITINGRFWMASSETEWYRLSSTSPLIVLPYGEAVDMWREEAQQGRLDKLQHLLFVVCKGCVGDT